MSAEASRGYEGEIVDPSAASRVGDLFGVQMIAAVDASPEAAAHRRPGRVLLQVQVHALVASVLLGVSRLDAFDCNAESGPRTEELGEIEKTVVFLLCSR